MWGRNATDKEVVALAAVDLAVRLQHTFKSTNKTILHKRCFIISKLLTILARIKMTEVENNNYPAMCVRSN